MIAPDAPPEPMTAARFCAQLLAHNRALVRAAVPDPEQVPYRNELPLPAHFDVCLPDAHGLWALELEQLESTPEDPGGLQGVWNLLRWSPEGVVLRETPHTFSWGPNTPYNHLQGWQYYETVRRLQVADQDGDGVPEVVLELGTFADEGHDRSTGFLAFTARGGALTRYPLPEGVAAISVEDVDHDGRLDVVHGGPFTSAEGTCLGILRPFRGPLHLLHGRPDGTFVGDDPTAVAFLRAGCPARPGDVAAPLRALGRSREGWYEAEVRTRLLVACARVWGVPSATLLRQLSGVCRRYADPDSCAAVALPPGACPLYLRQWALASPAVSLGP
jgi:hypothetical protein